MTAIKGFFNARQVGDEHAKSMFRSIDGNSADSIIPDLPGFLKAAGRDYGILRVPALVNDPFGGLTAEGEITAAVREVDNQYHLARTNDGRVVSPHTVTGQYAPLTLLDIAAEIQPWCNDGWLTPDAVYSGKNESLELLCLRMDAGGQLPNGETWQHYVVFRNPHGSGGKAKGNIISYRERCSNAFASVGRGIEFTVGHRISAEMTDAERMTAMAKRVQDAKAAWKAAESYIKKLADRVNVWSTTSVSAPQALKLSNKLFDVTNDDDASKQKLNQRDAVMQAFNMPQYGTNGATLFDWMNAVTFMLSSPHADIVKKSKVSATDRMIRNILPTESGYKLSADAEDLANDFLSQI